MAWIVAILGLKASCLVATSIGGEVFNWENFHLESNLAGADKGGNSIGCFRRGIAAHDAEFGEVRDAVRGLSVAGL
jgi:hypothetical protein